MKKILLLVAVIAIMVPQAIAGNYSLADFTVQELSENDSNVGIVPPYLDLEIKDAAGNSLPAVVRNTGNPLVFTAEPYIPVQYFNGTYTVETIPYNPADSSFRMGPHASAYMDDEFANSVDIPYPFYFFGVRKNTFRLGQNGLITFCSDTNFGTGSACPYSIPENSHLPWSNASNTPGGESMFNRMHDAIYGIYEDTYLPHYSGGSPGRGIYYGIQDEMPRRKIICSWNDIAIYSCSNLHCTHQIVCYEGTNIIEVHVKQRQACANWQGGRAFIGIQNATGQPQQSGGMGTSTQYVVSGSPAAFWPEGYNPSTGDFDSMAFRFTPQGTRSFTANWYRIFDDGRPDLLIGTSESDTNGYCVPVNSGDSQHPTLTSLTVNPGSASRYMLHVHILTADTGVSYDLYDTVEISAPGVYQVEAIASDAAKGAALGSGLYSEGSTATLIAAPFKGFAFNGWNNGAESNPYSLLVQSDTTVTALFMPAIIDTVYDTVIINNTPQTNDFMSYAMQQRTFIPDGTQCEPGYVDIPLNIDGFADNSTIAFAGDIRSVCVNMEHSFMGDLFISVICPSGQEAFLKLGNSGSDEIVPNYQAIISVTGHGGGADLGGALAGTVWNTTPVCDSLQNPYGWGLSYCFSRQEGYTLVTGDNAGSVWSDSDTLPAGNFYITSTGTIGFDTITFPSRQIPAYFTNQGGVATTDTTMVTKRPSIHETKTNYYLPVSTFEQLVGCPVNGEWNLRLRDTWGIDNGWLFGWDIDIENSVYDTTPIYVHDTVFIYDTLWLTPHDTVWQHDTIYVHDTTYVGIGEAEVLDAKVYSNNGQIVVEGAEGHEVMLFDVNGRMLATRRDDINPLCFDVPASGTYLIKIGRHAARKVVAIR